MRIGAAMKTENRSYRNEKFEHWDCWYENYQVCVDRKWIVFALWFVGGIDEQGHEESTSKLTWKDLSFDLEHSSNRKKMKKNLAFVVKNKKEPGYNQIRIDK